MSRFFTNSAEQATRRWLIGSALVFGPVFWKMTERETPREPPKKPLVLIKNHEGPILSLTEQEPSKQVTKEIIKKPSQKPVVMEAPTKDALHVPYVLVGSGTAAYSAMEAIKAQDPSAQILLITEDSHPMPYLRPPLSKELWFSGDLSNPSEPRYKDWKGQPQSIYYRPAQDFRIIKPSDLLNAKDNSIPIIAGYPVQRLNVSSKTLVLANGQKIAYDKVLIATGGSAKKPAFMPSSDKANKVMTFRSLADFQKLNAWTDSDDVSSIAVIGGGFLGSELAVALAHKASDKYKVIQVFPETGNMAAILPSYLTQWTTKQLQKLGIDVRPSVSIKQIDVSSNDSVALHLNNGEEIRADRVVVAAGLVPNTTIAEQSGLELDPVRGGIMVNAELEARSDVFVAGDVSSFHDVSLGLRRRVEHHDHAMMSGKQAGENMVGPKQPYTHNSMFWSDLGPHISYEAVGHLDASLTTVSIWASDESGSVPASHASSKDFNKGAVLYLDPSKRIVGVLLWNLFGKTEDARKLIAKRTVFEDVKQVAGLVYSK